jgi:hypothetical protein
MNVLVNPDGTRSNLYRPSIDEQNLIRNVTPYTPYYRPAAGLYSAPAQPYCGKFSTLLNWYRQKGLEGAQYGVTPNGRIVWY